MVNRTRRVTRRKTNRRKTYRKNRRYSNRKRGGGLLRKIKDSKLGKSIRKSYRNRRQRRYRSTSRLGRLSRNIRTKGRESLRTLRRRTPILNKRASTLSDSFRYIDRLCGEHLFNRDISYVNNFFTVTGIKGEGGDNNLLFTQIAADRERVDAKNVQEVVTALDQLSKEPQNLLEKEILLDPNVIDVKEIDDDGKKGVEKFEYILGVDRILNTVKSSGIYKGGNYTEKIKLRIERPGNNIFIVTSKETEEKELSIYEIPINLLLNQPQFMTDDTIDGTETTQKLVMLMIKSLLNIMNNYSLSNDKLAYLKNIIVDKKFTDNKEHALFKLYQYYFNKSIVDNISDKYRKLFTSRRKKNKYDYSIDDEDADYFMKDRYSKIKKNIDKYDKSHVEGDIEKFIMKSFNSLYNIADNLHKIHTKYGGEGEGEEEERKAEERRASQVRYIKDKLPEFLEIVYNISRDIDMGKLMSVFNYVGTKLGKPDTPILEGEGVDESDKLVTDRIYKRLTKKYKESNVKLSSLMLDLIRIVDKIGDEPLNEDHWQGILDFFARKGVIVGHAPGHQPHDEIVSLYRSYHKLYSDNLVRKSFKPILEPDDEEAVAAEEDVLGAEPEVGDKPEGGLHAAAADGV